MSTETPQTVPSKQSAKKESKEEAKTESNEEARTESKTEVKTDGGPGAEENPPVEPSVRVHQAESIIRRNVLWSLGAGKVGNKPA